MREFELLKKYNIDIAKYKKFTIEQKLEFDTFPAVLKLISSKFTHKSELNAVILDIKNNKELNDAKKKIEKNLKKAGMTLSKDDLFLVQEEIIGTEFYIGGIYDAIFEEVILFGKGGVFLEIQKDICYIDTYAEEEEIIRSFKRTKISKIFPHFRGKNYDLEKVVSLIKNFQKLLLNEDIKEIDINPIIYTNNRFVAVDVRIKYEKKRKKRKRERKFDIFENKSIAIFGASDKKDKVGYAIAKNSLTSKSNIFFINLRLDSLFDKKVYKSIEEIEEKIDTAVLAIPSKFVIETLYSLAKKGVKNIIIISAGFKESQNIKDELKIKEIADEFGLNIVGPNCLGIYNSFYDLNLTFSKTPILKGDIALLSQSGAVLTALLDKAFANKIGFDKIISLGNMADFNFSDSIKALQKSSCRYISIYAEGINDGKEFLKAIRESRKPILLYKAGKTKEAKKAAFSHTGNISADYDMFIELTKSAGAIIKDDMDSLIFSTKFLQYKEVLIVTNAGGPGTILTDIVVEKGKKLYKLKSEDIEKLNSILPSTWSKNNPIDIIGDATSKRYENTLNIFKDKNILIFVIVTPQFMTDSLNIAKILVKFNIIPIFLGKHSFKEVFAFFEHKNRLYFDDLENIKNIL